MRNVLMLSTAAALALTVVSVDLVAQRPGGPERNADGTTVERVGPGARGPGRGGPARFGRGPFGGGARAGVALRGLDLTEEQRAKVQEIARASRENTAPVADQLRTARQSLRQALFADAADQAVVDDAAAKVAELEQRMADIRISTSTAIAGVLTPEQRATLRDGIGQGPGAAVRRGGPGRGPGRGPARGAAGTRG